jgi:hypothetical protein
VFAGDRFFGFPGFARFAFLARFVFAFVFLTGFPFALALFPFAFPFAFGLGGGALGARRRVPLRARPAFAAVAFVAGGFAFGPPLSVAFGRRLPRPGPGTRPGPGPCFRTPAALMFVVAVAAGFGVPRGRSGPCARRLAARGRDRGPFPTAFAAPGSRFLTAGSGLPGGLAMAVLGLGGPRREDAEACDEDG